MSRRRAAEKREVLPDAKFGDVVLSKFMNTLMERGKKSVAERVVYGARPRPLPLRSTEAERAAHAEFIQRALKDKAVWLSFEEAL